MLSGAVIMPQPWRGGMLNNGILFSNLLNRITFRGQKISVAFAVPRGYDKSLIRKLDKEVEVIEAEAIALQSRDQRFAEYVDTENLLYPDLVSTFIDRGVRLASADFWIVMTGLTGHGPMLPWKPVAIYAPDFIQRYVPGIWPSDIEQAIWTWNANQNVTMQRAECVFATTPRTGQEAVSYAGVAPERVVDFPMVHAPLFDIDSDSAPETDKGSRYKSLLTGKKTLQSALGLKQATGRSKKTDGAEAAEERVSEARAKVRSQKDFVFAHEEEWLEEPFFLWITNSTPHKNHQRAIEALAYYYAELGGKVKCYICGATTQYFLPDDDGPGFDPYHKAIGTRLNAIPGYGRNVRLLGELPANIYKLYLRKAGFVWHNVLNDNGTFSVVDAAIMGTRSLVSDYPQLRYLCEHFGLNVEYFDAYDPEDASRALLDMQKQLAEGRTQATVTIPADAYARAETKMIEVLEMTIGGALAHSPASKGG